MMGIGRIACSLAFVLSACHPAATGGGAGKVTATPTSGDAEREASNRGPGELLEETVPLLSGEALDLASLHGRVVLLELSATWVETWEEAHQQFGEMLRQNGDDDLVVIVVSLDTERDRLEADWERNAHPFLLGWDPQGALAARLQVVALPTVFVVGRDGRIAHVLSGSDPSDRNEMAGHVRAAVASR
jgi:peroxiredoxin